MRFEEWKIEFSILCCLLKSNVEVIEASRKPKEMAKVKLRAQGRPRGRSRVPSGPRCPPHCHLSLSPALEAAVGVCVWRTRLFLGKDTPFTFSLDHVVFIEGTGPEQ